MDWTILPLQIILTLQAIAVVGVSLMLIADSYTGKSEIDDESRGQSWARDRIRTLAATTDPDRRRPADP